MIMYCDICGEKFDDSDDLQECPDCLCPFENVDKKSPIKSFKSPIPHGGLIKSISTDESFIQAMTDLYQKDPIEYQLKINQFKLQQEQSKQVKQESSKAINNNIPKCPTCGSTKLSKVSGISKAGSVFMFGLLSQKVKKTWHCDNCKYEW